MEIALADSQKEGFDQYLIIYSWYKLYTSVPDHVKHNQQLSVFDTAISYV